MTFLNQPGCGEIAINCNTYGVSVSPVPLLQDNDSESFIRQKTLHPHPATYRKAPHKATRATFPKKRAGAETTYRTAWIEYQSLPWFCLYDPPPGGRSKLTVYSPKSAVLQCVLNWCFLRIRILGRAEPKAWLVIGDPRHCRGFAGGE